MPTLIDYNAIKDSNLVTHNQWTNNISNRTVLIFSPSWYLDLRVYSVVLRNATGEATVYYLNESGGWTQVWHQYKGIQGSGNSHYYFSHNHSHANDPAPEGAPNDIHVWKVVFSLSSSGGQALSHLDIYLYNNGNYTQEQYNSLNKNKLIYGQVIDYWNITSGSTYSTEQACIEDQRCLKYRGSHIYQNTSVKPIHHRKMNNITG